MIENFPLKCQYFILDMIWRKKSTKTLDKVDIQGKSISANDNEWVDRQNLIEPGMMP